MSITEILSMFSFYCVFKYLDNFRKQYNFSSNATINYDIEGKFLSTESQLSLVYIRYVDTIKCKNRSDDNFSLFNTNSKVSYNKF